MRTYAKKVMDTAILAGKIMLECNAESYRVEETMNYILKTSNFETCEAFSMATGIFATLDDDCIDSITEIKRIPNRDINLNAIYQVNEISRQLSAGTIDIDQAYASLKAIKKETYPQWLKDLGVILMCAFYAVLYGASLQEMILAGLGAIILPFFYYLDRKFKLGNFLLNIFSITTMVLIIIFLQRHFAPGARIGIGIIGGIMPAVPGTSITNAIRDTLRGDYNSGLARAMEAGVIAVSVSLGVVLGLFLGGGTNPL